MWFLNAKSVFCIKYGNISAKEKKGRLELSREWESAIITDHLYSDKESSEEKEWAALQWTKREASLWRSPVGTISVR